MYIDPGGFSLFLQVIIGTVASAFVVISIHFQKVSGFLRKKKKKEEETPLD
jgi:hypothetical protein